MAKEAAKEIKTKDPTTEEVPQQSTFESMIGASKPDETGTVPEDDETSSQMSNQELATYTQEPDFDADDILIPRLRLGQGLTPEVMDNQAEVGDWILTGSDPVKTVAFLPLYFSRRRQYRESGDDRNIMCGSDDAVNGDGEPGGNCKECTLAKWTVSKSGARRPPACTFLYSYLGYSITHQTVVMLNFKRTALPAGKVLNTIVARNGLGKKAVELGAARVTKNNRTYYIPVVRPAALTADEIADIKKKSMF